MTLIASAASRLQRSVIRAALHTRDAIGGLGLAAGVRPSRLVRHDLLSRPAYALGLVLASAQAVRLGLGGISVIELGVGAGGGLLNLCRLCDVLTREFALSYQIVGFDTGEGLPPPADYRDHPEIWRAAQYVHDRDALRRALSASARVEYGDVATTAPAFIAAATAARPADSWRSTSTTTARPGPPWTGS